MCNAATCKIPILRDGENNTCVEGGALGSTCTIRCVDGYRPLPTQAPIGAVCEAENGDATRAFYQRKDIAGEYADDTLRPCTASTCGTLPLQPGVITTTNGADCSASPSLAVTAAMGAACELACVSWFAVTLNAPVTTTTCTADTGLVTASWQGHTLKCEPPRCAPPAQVSVRSVGCEGCEVCVCVCVCVCYGEFISHLS